MHFPYISMFPLIPIVQKNLKASNLAWIEDYVAVSGDNNLFQGIGG
jgi:hypothetical protein